MKYTSILLAILVCAVPLRGESLLVNGDFEMDGGPFNIPTGWVPMGCAKFEGRWEDGEWVVQIADLHPGHTAGLGQVVPHVKAGARYRLTAQARSGHPNLEVSIELASTRADYASQAASSEIHQEHEWTTLSTEIVARYDTLLVALKIKNVNRKHQLLQAGTWKDVRLELIEQDAEQPRPDSPRLRNKPPEPSDPLGQLADLWSLASPKPGVRTHMASSHHPDRENNADFDRTEGHIEIDAEAWTVLTSIDGPGALLRIWMTNFARDGQIRFEIDGHPSPPIKLFDFFGAAGDYFSPPLVNQTTGAWVAHLPVPFTKSLRVLVKGAEQDRFYWQVTWQAFATGQNEQPLIRDRLDLAHVLLQWVLATVDPKPELPGTREVSGEKVLPAGQAVALWSAKDAGMVAALWIDVPSDEAEILQGLRLRATWDGADKPQVDAPLGLFFTIGWDRTISRGLLVGMAPPDGGYCYFPMPFARGARIELVNTTDRAIQNIRFRLRWVPRFEYQVSRLRFHATHRHEKRAGDKRLFVPLEVEGRGHFVGLTAAMADPQRTSYAFLEGDEYIWVDGETEPSIAGTGTEDYFSCGWYFSAGPITLPAIGATEVNGDLFRVCAYRLHVPDWIPFERSFKFGLEVGDRVSSPTVGDYSTVAYYYLE